MAIYKNNTWVFFIAVQKCKALQFDQFFLWKNAWDSPVIFELAGLQFLAFMAYKYNFFLWKKSIQFFEGKFMQFVLRL